MQPAMYHRLHCSASLRDLEEEPPLVNHLDSPYPRHRERFDIVRIIFKIIDIPRIPSHISQIGEFNERRTSS